MSLAQFANSTANPDFAQVFPAVVVLADLGDTSAQTILRHAGEELATLADTVLARLFNPMGARIHRGFWRRVPQFGTSL